MKFDFDWPSGFRGEDVSILWKYIEDICLFEVNTKYISSSELKISEFSRVRSTSEIFDVFNSRDEIYLVFTEKKANFLFILHNTRAFSYSQSRR